MPNRTSGMPTDGPPLRHAVTFSENPEVIEALLNGGADRNERDADGWTLLHIVGGYEQ